MIDPKSPRPRRWPAVAAAFSLLLGRAAQAGDEGKPRYPERWVYCSANLQVEPSVQGVIALIERAKRGGYTALMLADYKLPVLDRAPDSYFRNAEKVKAAATRAGIELVQAIFSIGYSNGHLAHDPCRDRKMTPGQLLAEDVRLCTRIVKSINPRSRIVVWSDMFDPYHNAVDSYYLVNGSLKGSREGLGRDVVIANWNRGKAGESLGFFDGLGHRQLIAGYYDADDLSNSRAWDQAARDIRGIMGFMYTTWANKYNLLESYGEVLEAAHRR